MKNKVTTVFVGNIGIGGNHPIRIQSMTNTPTHHIEKTVNQIITIWKAGADFVRITIPNTKDLEATKKIKALLTKQNFNIPLVADIHFSPKLAIRAAAIVDKIRINPGNFAELGNNIPENEQQAFIRKKVSELIAVCNQYETSIRIGVNHGSLPERILQKYGNTAEGMVALTMQYLMIFNDLKFKRVIVSLKSSNPLVMVYANRLLKRKMIATNLNFPLHIGVTEAGDSDDGRIKSALGIGTLLQEKIGSTIRVSLTEPPEKEIPVAKKIICYAKEKTAISSDFKNITYPEIFSKRKVSATSLVDFNKYPQVLIAGKNFRQNKSQYIAIDNKNHSYEKTVVPFSEHITGIPIFTVNTIDKLSDYSGKDKMLLITFNEIKANILKIKNDKLLILIYHLSDLSPVYEVDAFFDFLKKEKINNPVIFHKNYTENDLETLQIKVAMDFGRPFINGYGNGLFITNHGTINNTAIQQIAYDLLQATRMLITKTEYIACPSCGRTLFDLESTTQKIRKKTAHLKGLKIAIMGCIVNGIGEMADADYGYVGGTPGKISLYKKRKLIKKNIPEENAVDELIKLIKDNGDWQDIHS